MFYVFPEKIRLPFALEYLDVALLGGAILLAAHLALKARNRNAILALSIFSLLHFGFWRQGCICPIGAIQTVAAALFDRSYAISPIVILFFLLPLVLTVFFGRSFCAAVCPLGALQDVVVVRAVRVPAPLAHALRMLGWVYLGLAVLLAAVGSAFIICQYDPFVALFRLDGSFEMLVLGAAFVAAGLFVARPYCRFLCPYGAILRVLSACSWRRVTITPAECVRCRLCEDSCPYGAIRPANASEPSPPRRRGRWALVAMLVLLPVLVLGGRWGVGKLAAPLARSHEIVLLAERITAEDRGREKQHDDATAALAAMLPADRETRIEEIREEAAVIEGRFRTGTRWLGALLGLVIGLKLVGLSVRRRRTDYIADPATCVSCGRCFAACPVDRRQRKFPERD
jgi:ferredoxin